MNKMKNLYIIGGSMGVGKSSTCRILRDRLERCVFLDGDWCWDMRPFTVTEETKRMVMGNITFCLNSFLSCSEFENVVFCWVLHEQGIIDGLLRRLELSSWEVHIITLICREDKLRERLMGDVEAGVREADVIGRSIARLPLYDRLNTVKLDVSDISAEKAAEIIMGGTGKTQGEFRHRSDEG
ncbi:MAG: AAA family ATPase [Oscillospiraceae bacterium]